MSGLRALLIAGDHELALWLGECLADLPEPQPTLDWLATHDAGLTAIARAEHDLYLIDCSDLAAGLPLLVVPASAAGAVIALVAPHDDHAEAAALESGAGDAIVKGECDSRALGRSIQRALNHAQTLAAIRASAGPLQPMIDGLSALVVVLDARGVILVINAAWRRVLAEQGLDLPRFGVGQEYLAIGAPFWSADHAAAITAGIGGIIAGERRDFSREYACTLPRGEHWFVLHAVRLDGEGAGRVLIAHEDVTARMHDQVLLRRREQEFRALAEHNPDLIARFDRDLRATYANPAMHAAVAQFASEHASEPTAQCGPLAGIAERIREDVAVAFAQGGERTVEFAVATPVATHTFQVRIVPERDGAGAFETVLIIGRDITARKATEAALRASEEEYRQILEQAADAIFISEGLGRYVVVNAQACALTGFTREELLGMSVADLAAPGDVGDLPRRAALLTRQRAATNEREIRHKDGSLISVEVSVSTLAGGRLQAIMRDIRERKAIDRALRESESRLRTLVQTAPVILFSFDANGIFTLLEGRGLSASGRQPGELVGRSVEEVYADYPLVLANSRRALAGEALTVRQWIRDAFFETHYSPVFGDGGELQGVSGISIDLTERLQSEQALAQRESQLAEAQRIAHLGSWDFDLLTEALAWSDEVYRIFGYEPGEVPVSDELYWSAVHPEDRPRVRQAMEQSLDDRLCYTVVHRVVRPNGAIRTVEVRAEVLLDAQDRAVRRAGTILDITERKVLEERLIHDAFHDALTGLPNRALFAELLTNALARARRTAGAAAILFLDVDRFKDVNDTLGHDVGDQLLLAVAALLRARVGERHTIARFGGDEFTILLAGGADVDDAVRVATELIAAFQSPITLNGRDHLVSASIGIVVGGADYARPEEMLRDADVAMYRAKSAGKACYALFDPAMRAELAERLQLERDLWLALARDEFTLHYQPIYDLALGVPIEVEALVRWLHPERGMIPPDRFIAIAEECGAIRDLGRWVLGEACRQGRSWLSARPDAPPLTVSVNLSTRELQDAAIVGDVAQALAAADYPAHLLRLEITESAAMADAEATLRVLAALKQLGVQVAIDDFGTGYSSLAYLQRFPVDAVKIDRAFIRDLSDGATSMEICRAITMLARALELEVTAEGIETPEQVALVRGLQCHRAQGYYFSRPRPAAALADTLGLATAE